MIFIDADACPVAIRDIIIRAGERTKLSLCFVANHPIPLPKRDFIRFVHVEKGFDIADHEIVKQIGCGDLVITQDIPLAAEVIELGAQAIGLRGQIHTRDNIKSRLVVRDFMETMRASGEHTAGPPPLSAKDKQAFANALDKYIHAVMPKH